MHPALLRSVAAFVARSFVIEAPGTQLVDDEDSPLWIRTASGETVRSDPEYRVAQFVIDGRRALLSDYLSSALRG